MHVRTRGSESTFGLISLICVKPVVAVLSVRTSNFIPNSEFASRSGYPRNQCDGKWKQSRIRFRQRRDTKQPMWWLFSSRRTFNFALFLRVRSSPFSIAVLLAMQNKYHIRIIPKEWLHSSYKVNSELQTTPFFFYHFNVALFIGRACKWFHAFNRLLSGFPIAFSCSSSIVANFCHCNINPNF